MTKLVTIKADFRDMAAYQDQNPSKVEFLYFNGGKLTPRDRAKVDAITRYLLHNDLWPIFIIEDKDARPLIAEATLDLGSWTKDGRPMFALRDMQNRRIKAPTFKEKKTPDEQICA